MTRIASRDGAAGVRRVVQDPPGVDAIERAVLERQGLGVGDHHLALQAFELETASHELNGMLGEVDPGRDRAGAHEANEVGPEPHADLEQPLSLGAVEVREPRDVGVELGSGLLDLGEEFRGAFGRAGMLGAARLLLPEVAHPTLLVYS